MGSREMDVQLLRVYDKAQDINALYKEILRNVRNTNWYWHVSNRYRHIDHLHIEEQANYFRARTSDNFWTVERWINLT